MEKCKAKVYTGGQAGSMRGHPCANNATKDGFCKIHHPDSAEARRQKSRKKFDEARARDPLLVALRHVNILKEKLDAALVGLNAAKGFVQEVHEKYGVGKSFTLEQINKAIKKVEE